MKRGDTAESRTHSEYAVDAFTKFDGGIRFYGFVHAIILKTDADKACVLDFGAGRGGFFYNRDSEYSKYVQDLRNTGAEVWAADVDSIVLEHPCSNHQVQFDPAEPLPFEDEQFDVIVSDMVFEHLADPASTMSELRRILKPGGWICVRTPNKWGYLALCTRLIPNTLHERVLKWVQPNRKPGSVFPTVYKLNSPKDLKRHFSEDDVHWYYDIAEPAYHCGRVLIYRALLLMHRLLPPKLAVCVCMFVRKRSG